MGEWRCSFAHF